MSNTSLCTYDGECRHCTPEQMRENAKELLGRLSAQGTTGLVYASTLARGKCREYDKAIEIERYRRGWVNRFWFDTVGCPTFIYEALKDETGLPPKTAAALHRYEELNHITKELPAPESALGLFVDRNKVWTTSRDVAAKFEKPHNDVLKAIRALDCSPEFSLGNFSQSDYVTDRGKKYPQYLMTRDGFTFLAMGFTGPKAARFKELYIAEFNRMEEELYRRRFSAAGSREELDRLTAQCETERKRAATAIGHLRTARASEEKMKHQLNKALDIIARLTA